MESISESPDGRKENGTPGSVPATQMDATKGEWDEDEQDGPQTDREKKNSMMKEDFRDDPLDKMEAGEEEGVDVMDMVPEARFTDMEEKANPLG